MEAKEDFTTAEVSVIQMFGLFGLYCTFFSGLALDRYGPIRTAIVGALCIIFGYFSMAAAAKLDNTGLSNISLNFKRHMIINKLLSIFIQW